VRVGRSPEKPDAAVPGGCSKLDDEGGPGDPNQDLKERRRSATDDWNAPNASIVLNADNIESRYPSSITRG
jgi:hypothetical protein